MVPHGEAVDYENEVYEKGLQYERPPFTFKALEWEHLAKERMSAESCGYVVGNAGTGETTRKNREAFGKWSIVPKRLVKTDRFPAMETTALGHNLRLPFAMAPVGVNKIFHPSGETAAAAAASKEHVPYIMSTASSTSIEDVAQASGDGTRWFQLYWPAPQHNDITLSLLSRAKKAGFSALIVTLDTYMLGWRPSDMDNGYVYLCPGGCFSTTDFDSYNPFLRADQIGVAIGFTDPVFVQHFKTKHGFEIHENEQLAAAEWTSIVFPQYSHGWEDIKFLQDNWQGPIVLKGIQSIEDAQKCADLGIQGIVVSNHGGRQADGGSGSLSALPGIVDAVGDRVEVFFDSGIRCGADIAKALALGAQLCLIGRPYVYGLAIGGENGVSHVLRSLAGELELTLHLAGIKSTSNEDLNRKVLVYER